MCHLGTQFSEDLVRARLRDGLSDLSDLSLSKWFCDSTSEGVQIL